MQCPSCNFHNMPGSGNCARCGASLRLGGDIDVHPPRASSLQKRMPALWSLRFYLNRLRAGMWAAFTGVTNFAVGSIAEHPPSLLGWIVPGLAQMQRGDKARGWGFLAGFLICLTIGLVLMGTVSGSIFLGLAFTMQVTGLVDAIASTFATIADRGRLTATVMAALAAFVYFPAMWAIGRVATPVQITANAAPFERGDVVWYNRMAEPKLGDVVIYEIPEFSAGGHLRNSGYNARIRIDGQRVNRIVGRGGQKVEVREGQLLVDGAVSPWQPTTPRELLPEFAIMVPAESLFILPDNLVSDDVILNANPWQQLGIVPASAVRGRVYFRSLPWGRMSFVN